MHNLLPNENSEILLRQCMG